MKKLTLFALLTPSIFFAQTSLENSSVWRYNSGGLFEGYSVVLSYNSDTLIQGKNCQNLEYSSKSLQYGGKSNPYSFFTYISGDTIFYLRDNKFYRLYNFDAQVGDSIDLDYINTEFRYQDCTKSIVHIDSIGTTVINNEILRWIAVSTNPYSCLKFNGKIIEKIGNSNGFFFPYLNSCPRPKMIDCYFDYWFKCYKNNDFPAFVAAGSICEPTNISEIISTKTLEILPSITSNTFLVQTNLTKAKIKTIQILDAQGKNVPFTKNENNCDISNLSSGLYFVRVILNDQSNFVQKVVKE